MKKLILAEVVMVALTAVVAILGHSFGWSEEVTLFVAVAATTTIAVAAVAATAATAIAATTATVVAATAIAATIAAALAFAALAFAAFAFAFAFAKDFKLKYRWVLLSLLVEGVAIWTIFRYT